MVVTLPRNLFDLFLFFPTRNILPKFFLSRTLLLTLHGVFSLFWRSSSSDDCAVAREEPIYAKNFLYANLIIYAKSFTLRVYKFTLRSLV